MREEERKFIGEAVNFSHCRVTEQLIVAFVPFPFRLSSFSVERSSTSLRLARCELFMRRIIIYVSLILTRDTESKYNLQQNSAAISTVKFTLCHSRWAISGRRDARVASFSLSVHALRIFADYCGNANHDCSIADIPVEMFSSKHHYNLIFSHANILTGHNTILIGECLIIIRFSIRGQSILCVDPCLVPQS